MKATALEYRFRFAIHGLLFGLAFWAPWVGPLGWTSKSTWLVLSTISSREQWLTFTTASYAILIYMLVFTGLGAWLRVWGSAYIGASVVQSGAMHGQTMQADGPYRHTRNPLYLGTLLHILGFAMLLAPSGAIFLVATLWVFQYRLALAEEPFLLAQFGQPYKDYVAHVPRFLPMLAPQVPPAGAPPHWLLAFLGEIYFTGVFITLAICGWNFNPTPVRQGILISLGLWIVVIAIIPRPKPEQATD